MMMYEDEASHRPGAKEGSLGVPLQAPLRVAPQDQNENVSISSQTPSLETC